MRAISRLPLILLFFAPVISPAQEVRIREKAITLLERANSISTPHEFASYEQVITFQSFTPAGDAERSVYQRRAWSAFLS